MSPPPAIMIAPAPPEPAQVSAQRRMLFSMAFLGAALLGAAAGLISARGLH